MTRRLRLIFTLVLLSSFFVPFAKAQNPQSGDSEDIKLAAHVPGELLIRFTPGLNSAQATSKMSEMGLEHKREIPGIGIHLVKLPSGLSVEKAIDNFSHRPEVEFVEPNYLLEIQGVNQEITDQWSLEKIRAVQAWGTFSEEQKLPIILATVDSGVMIINDIYPRSTTGDGELKGGDDWVMAKTHIKRRDGLEATPLFSVM